MKKACLLIIIPLLALSQGSSTGAGFLNLPLVARNASLGEAVIADDSHFSSSVINPSLHALNQRMEFLIGHQEWIQDVQSEFFAARVPLAIASLSFSFATTSIAGIELREIPGPPSGTFTARSAVFSVSAALELNYGVHAGLTGKYLYEKIYVNETTGLGLDLGASMPLPVDGMTAGISVINLGSARKFREQSSNLPSRLSAGISHSTEAGELGLNTFAAVSHVLNSQSTHVHLGVEGTIRSAIAVRIGYISGHESRSVSGGIGVTYGMFLFDYGFVPFTFGLGSGHLATLGVRL